MKGDWKVFFTRDYNQQEGAFLYQNNFSTVILHEYIEDLKTYLNKKFKYEETDELLHLMINFLQKAEKENKNVIVSYD